MKPRTPPESAEAGGENQLEELLGDYVDRLNSGQSVDPWEIVDRYPDLAHELLLDLRMIQDLKARQEQSAPLPTIGDYTLRHEIGRGGMGVVYEAWDNPLGRVVALKVLPLGLVADARSSARFFREARVAGKLHHPNVVPVYAMGVRRNTPYYSMEYVEGETLATILARVRDEPPDGGILGSPLPGFPVHLLHVSAARQRGEALSVKSSLHRTPARKQCFDLATMFAEVADALQHAHDRGIVHRDIKPSNLILDRAAARSPAGGGRLRILDFGLALLEGAKSLTVIGHFVGTLPYTSPEQTRARKIPVDGRADIYGLGATMYEALTGRPPFGGQDREETLREILLKDPPELRSMDHRIPRDLETIVLKCLRKEPADRYRTADGLAKDLRRFARGDPIEERPRPQ